MVCRDVKTVAKNPRLTFHNLGKLNRGMSVVDTVEILKGRELSEEEYTNAAILGWCVELVSGHMYFLYVRK